MSMLKNKNHFILLSAGVILNCICVSTLAETQYVCPSNDQVQNAIQNYTLYNGRISAVIDMPYGTLVATLNDPNLSNYSKTYFGSANIRVKMDQSSKPDVTCLIGTYSAYGPLYFETTHSNVQTYSGLYGTWVVAPYQDNIIQACQGSDANTCVFTPVQAQAIKKR